MWPFDRQQKKPGAKLDKLPYETICTLCLERYPPGEILAEYPVCSDCDSEGMGIHVERFDAYIAGKNAQYFDDMLKWWDAKDGFRPEYKALKRGRILALKALAAR